MVVKGVPLALSYYRDIGCRPMNDVDVLVRTDRMADAFRVLGDDGWLGPRDGWQRQPPITAPFSLTGYHSRRVVSPDGFVVDLHWHLRAQFILPRTASSSRPTTSGLQPSPSMSRE